jgi:hypothetical protein
MILRNHSEIRRSTTEGHDMLRRILLILSVVGLIGSVCAFAFTACGWSAIWLSSGYYSALGIVAGTVTIGWIVHGLPATPAPLGQPATGLVIGSHLYLGY